jgi:hypothetical protein
MKLRFSIRPLTLELREVFRGGPGGSAGRSSPTGSEVRGIAGQVFGGLSQGRQL